MAGDQKKKLDCGLKAWYRGMFRRRKHPHRRSSTNISIPQSPPANYSAVELELSSSNLKDSLVGSDQGLLIVPVRKEEQINVRSPLKPRTSVASYRYHMAGQKLLAPIKESPNPALRVHISGISSDLDGMIYDHQRAKGSSTLVRASSGNVMLYGNLGNLRWNRNRNNTPSASNHHQTIDYLRKTTAKKESKLDADEGKQRRKESNGSKSVMGNMTLRCSDEEPASVLLSRALSKRTDPDELKDMGNEEYTKGRFEVALALYDQAIMINPKKASYWSNKAAALSGLGRLLEAVAECREAVKIDPCYMKAHHRLATLYLRLGEAEKSLYHYKMSGNDTTSNDIEQAKTLQTHVNLCKEARKLRDWQTVLKHAQSAISVGADSSPQVFASKAEALLKLQRHQDAEAVLVGAPTFDIDKSTKFFGASGHAYVLAVRALVDMATGRFDNALSVAQSATQLVPSNKEFAAIARRAKAVASAQTRGNELFKASKFREASVAFGEGLDHDPHNSGLLCNRATCRSRLGQWEKAIEDCNIALNIHPLYSRARLQRADCYAKLGRWEASIQDYEVLTCEMPGDEEVIRGLSDVHTQLNKYRDEETKDMKSGTSVIAVTRPDQLKQKVSSYGTSVVFFFNKSSEVKQTMLFIELLCKRYPSVHFLKVDKEDNPNLVKSEGVVSVPAFKIYKNGSKIKEIAGSDHDMLESSLRIFGT